MNKILIFIFLWVAQSHYLKAQVYDAKYSSRNLAIVKLTTDAGQYTYKTNNVLGALNRRRHAFIFKIPADSILYNWRKQGFYTASPFEDDFVEIIVKTKSTPIDIDNYDGEFSRMECEIFFNGHAYNETAMFKGLYNEHDDVISSSFRTRLALTREDYLKGLYDEEYVGELELIVDDAQVVIKSDL